MVINKTMAYIIFALCAVLVILSFLYINNKHELENKCRLLSQAEANIISLQKDNENLIKYTVEKDKELKKVQQDYKKSLETKPTDACGDSKPSKELKEFLKANK